MTSILLSEGPTTKAKEAGREAGNFDFFLTDVAIPDGMSRVGDLDYLADAGIYTTEDDMVYGMDGSDSRNERMILKVVAHLSDSSHKYNPVALPQLAEAWPSSRTVSCELGAIGAYSFNEGGQLMANEGIIPFSGSPSLEVAYVAGVSLIFRRSEVDCSVGAADVMTTDSTLWRAIDEAMQLLGNTAHDADLAFGQTHGGAMRVRDKPNPDRFGNGTHQRRNASHWSARSFGV